VNPHQVTIVPFQGLEGLVSQSPGHGIFIDCGAYRMNVGTILPMPGGRYMLTVMIISGMQISDYQPCDFSGTYDRFDEAATAARSFLEAQRIRSGE
jgi:hypothetical protein